MISYLKILPILILLTLTAAACERQPSVQTYEEITIESPLKKMRMPALAQSGLPEGHPPIGDARMDMSAVSEQDQQMLKSSVADTGLTWSTPQGWTEEAGSGIRLVTFRSSGTDSIECSIVSLSGVAGGLEANISRWVGQIGISNLPEEKILKIISEGKIISAAGGISIRLVDLTPLVSASSDPAILGGVIQDPDKTIFIKMTGSKAAVTRERAAFESLCRSLSIKP